MVGDVRAQFVAEILGRFDSRVHGMLLGGGTMFVRRPNCVCAETGLLCLTVKAVLGSRNDECCHTQQVDGREKK